MLIPWARQLSKADIDSAEYVIAQVIACTRGMDDDLHGILALCSDERTTPACTPPRLYRLS